MLFEYGKLIKGGAVKDDIGIFLIGENPLFLSATHAIPHRESGLYRCTPRFIIAYGTAEQTKVACRDAVMVVEREGKQGADIHAENQVLTKAIGEKYGVQTMDAFDDDDSVFRQAQLVTYPFALAFFEVEE